MIRTSRGPAQTEQIAADLAATLCSGDCIALNGELGAGKTHFVHALVAALGGNPRTVSSPTYVLINIYPIAIGNLFHLDVFRLTGTEDLESIGFAELLDQPGIVVVEWASRVAELLPRRRIDVGIETLAPTSRRITIERR